MNRLAKACLAVGLVMVASLLTSCAPSAPSSADDKAAIDARREQIQAAENAGRAEDMGTAFDSALVILPPAASPIVGLTAAVDFLRNAFASTTMSVQYESLEVVVSNDLAFDRGTYKATTSPRIGGPASNDHGKYVWLLRRQADGSWKYSHIIWNSDVPPAAPK